MPKVSCKHIAEHLFLSAFKDDRSEWFLIGDIADSPTCYRTHHCFQVISGTSRILDKDDRYVALVGDGA